MKRRTVWALAFALVVLPLTALPLSGLVGDAGAVGGVQDAWTAKLLSARPWSTPLPVLQVQHGGGMIAPNRSSDMVPRVTLWDDGRVVFVAEDGIIRETRLAAPRLSRLLAAGAVLYPLAEHYRAFNATDLGRTFFTFGIGASRKTVSVYGMDLNQARPGEQDHAVLEHLRELWREVVVALPAQAPVMQPDEVLVVFPYGYRDKPTCSEAGVTAEWPAHLQGHVRGENAREAADLVGLGPAAAFCLEGLARWVTVAPVLPLLNIPSSDWPRGGLPRHPARHRV